ncbi:hypothetical protein DEJ32_04585 [Curtobacterium sp. MCPF17_046]|nr:hypothetical protein DEJ32_04585 [Curtobacterium sp. MCPF17_046]
MPGPVGQGLALSGREARGALRGLVGRLPGHGAAVVVGTASIGGPDRHPVGGDGDTCPWRSVGLGRIRPGGCGRRLYAVGVAGTTGAPADGDDATARRARRASGAVPLMDVRVVRAPVAVVPVVVSIVTPVVVFVTVVSAVPPTRGAVVG